MHTDLLDRQLDDLVSRRAATRLRSFRRDVEQAMTGRIVDVILFGSRARGDAGQRSDYDVAVLLSDLADPRAADRQLSDLAYPFLLDGFHIHPVALPGTFLTGPSLLPLRDEIRRDGVPIR